MRVLPARSHSHALSDLVAAYLRGVKHRGQLRLVNALDRITGHKRWNARTRYGFRIGLDLSDMIEHYMMLHGAWDMEVAECLLSRQRPDDVFFDVGANIGFFSLLALQQGMNIVAFEPMTELADIAASNFANNRFAERAHVEPTALSNKVGSASYEPGPVDNSAIGALTECTGARTRQVAVTTLDAYIERHKITPTMMKIDTEGHELQVLQGGERLLAATPPHTIIFEADVDGHNQISDARLPDLLTKSGYRIERLNEPRSGKCNFGAYQNPE